MAHASNADALLRVISTKGLNKLRDTWLAYWHRHQPFEGGNAEQWFHTVLDFLSARGDEVIPRELREQEEKLIATGRAKEYLAALAEVVQASPSHNEYDHTVLVLTASADDRLAALTKVLHPKQEAEVAP